MESNELIAMVIAICLGFFTILASILDWDFFFEHRRAQFFVNLIGRNGARAFYALLGLLLFYIAYNLKMG